MAPHTERLVAPVEPARARAGRAAFVTRTTPTVARSPIEETVAVTPVALGEPPSPRRVAGPAAAPATPPAQPSPVSQPPVVIDRIEIVTPPAGPPVVDPLGSVAARRAGLSRHGGGR